MSVPGTVRQLSKKNPKRKDPITFFKNSIRMTTVDNESTEMFVKKYEEFATDLLVSYPELAEQINEALKLSTEDRVARYRSDVFTKTSKLTRENMQTTPGTVLPGVDLTEKLWETTGKKSRQIIFEYISLLNLCVAFLGGSGFEEFTKEWAERSMRDARASMGSIDFEKLSQKFFNAFGTKGSALPPFPEKFLKGKLAKLAEDMVREFKPEDFGFSKEDLEACERDPTRAFEILMKGSMGNPKVIQSAMSRIAKKLQDKVSRGELRPQELIEEANSLMKEFESHPAFVEIMEAFRGMFGGDSMEEMQKAAGKDDQSRLSIVQARLRKKLEARRNKK